MSRSQYGKTSETFETVEPAMYFYRLRNKMGGFYLRRNTYKKASKTIWEKPGSAANAFRLHFDRLLKGDKEWELVKFKLVEVE